MPETVTVRVPDTGEAEHVEVIEVLVAPGERVEVDTSLVTLESDKATLEVPSTHAGIVREVLVAVDDPVTEGSPLVTLEVEAADVASDAPARVEETPAAAPAGASPLQAPAAGAADAEVLVLGGGPGGYTAAFRAADLGKRVVLVERRATLGGVCLNVGCIPSKALLHIAEVIHAAGALAPHGVDFGSPKLDFARIRAHKDEVVARLTGGLAKLASQRKVEVVRGHGELVGPNEVRVTGDDGPHTLSFEHAIVAVGSRPVALPGFPADDPRVLDSTAALEIDGEAQRLLVVGGGIIGLEMAAVYDALGSQVSVVELLPELMAGADRDLVRVLERVIRARYAGIHLATKVARVEATREALIAHFEGDDAPEPTPFDRVLVAVGRRPNSDRFGAEAAGIRLDASGFVGVDAQQRTNVPHIHAIGDVAGPPLLAHKATHEGAVAAEVIAGLPAAFDATAIPSVAYTDPEVAWTGLTESEAREQGIEIDKAVFPWAASGRALGILRSEGMTKLIFERGSQRVLGAGIVGANAGELIAEATLAIELGADVEDVALTIHAHPTLSETVGFAAEMAAGTITDLYAPRRRS
jgi:dihydrolipoamide dehydrogenase